GCHTGSYRRKPAHGSQTIATVTGRRSKKIGTLRHRSARDFELLNGCATSRPWFDFEGLNPPVGQMYPSKRVERSEERRVGKECRSRASTRNREKELNRRTWVAKHVDTGE